MLISNCSIFTHHILALLELSRCEYDSWAIWVKVNSVVRALPVTHSLACWTSWVRPPAPSVKDDTKDCHLRDLEGPLPSYLDHTGMVESIARFNTRPMPVSISCCFIIFENWKMDMIQVLILSPFWFEGQKWRNDLPWENGTRSLGEISNLWECL